VSPEPAASTPPDSTQTTPLTVNRVVGNLQLLLALRRSSRFEELATWTETARAA
jgi:hypothetical protein